MYSKTLDIAPGVLSYQIGKLELYNSKKDYADILHRINYYDKEHKKNLTFLTNNTNSGANEIALLYKKRLEVGVFFKRMKPHLKIKSFWGINLNVIEIQIYCAILTYF
jgi:IS4 transposase